MLALSVVVFGATWWPLWRRADRSPTAFWSWVALVSSVFGWLMSLARPSFLPLGTGPDLAHHLQLIRYIDEHWQLVHGRDLQPFLAEMTFYTPGSHILASLAGAWSGSTGLHGLQPLLSYVAALKVGLVALIARRMLPEFTPRDPLAIAVALTVFASQVFFLGSFLQFAFVAQVVAELFMLFAWWAVVAWCDDGGTRWLALFAIATSALFLTWPILVGPPFVMLGLVLLTQHAVPLRTRGAQGLVASVLPGCVAGSFVIDRIRWMGMAAVGGETALPQVSAYGWPFIAASTVGLLLALLRTRTRVTGLMAASILVQSAALWGAATWRHNSPYMAQKMFYGLLFVQAAGVAALVGELWTHVPRGRWQSAFAWLLATAAVVLTVRSVAAAPKRMAIHIQPAVTRPLELAGDWARANVPPQCVEYLVADDESSYWLHLAVLGNRRYSARSRDWDTYDFTKALLRWLTPGGLPYAIAELPAVPSGVREEFDIVARFGDAAVVKRRGQSACDLSPQS